MPEPRTLGPWLRRFFDEHLVTERNLARNTQKSYRDTFRLLLPFVSAKIRKPIDRLALRDLDSARVRQFLSHLEDGRGCSAQTRNQRLSAIRAFARFVASRDPAQVDWFGHIRALRQKKASKKEILFMTKKEMDALLDVPDRETIRGRIEHALLLFLYNTGARASEATRLTVGDLQFGSRHGRAPLVTLHGKGGKMRTVPMWEYTETVLLPLVDGREGGDAVFLNRYGNAFTRFGAYRLVERAAAGVPQLARKAITPHVLRHTTACMLMRSGVDLNTIREWLGHASLDTTNIYVQLDLKMKLEAVALCDVADPVQGPPSRGRNGIMAHLNAL